MSAWSIPLDRMAARTGLRLETVARKATLQVFGAVVLRSPVDTGRFRANWNVSFAAPDTTVTLSTNKGRADIEVSKALTLPVGGVQYLTNGLPYAEALEFGSSKQAPSGMVRLAAQEFNAYVQRAIRS